MNWLQKTASITFSIKDSVKISQPKTVLDLSYELLNWANSNLPDDFKIHNFWDYVTCDGDSIESMTGTINWYFPSRVNPDDLLPYIRQSIKDCFEPLGVNIGNLYHNKSNLYSEFRVWRIPIQSNETENLNKYPELNVSNVNAERLFRLLGLNFEYMGSINANSLKQHIQNARLKINDHVLPPSKETLTNQQGQEIGFSADPGFTEEKIIHLLKELSIITDTAIREFPNPAITWG